MAQKPETPFESIEGALEYTTLLLESAQEAHRDVEAEVALADEPSLARRKQALQLASYKLVVLTSHITATRKILNDLRMLRRLLLDERKVTQPRNPVRAKMVTPGK